MPHGFRIAAPVALLLALAIPAAHATQVLQLDTRQLVLGSNDIVVGEVESVQPRWNASRTKIFTDVRVRVTRTLKGAGAEHLTLSQLGGELGDIRYTVPGCPSFSPGEEALLFVWRDKRGTAQVNGLAQGKFEIRRDPSTGIATVQRSAPGMAVRDVRQLKLVPQGLAAPRIPLDELVEEIRRVMDEEDGR